MDNDKTEGAMPGLTDVQEFVECSRKARSLNELELVLESITGELGFDFYALVQHVDIRKSNNKETIWIGSYPQSWIEVFEADGLFATDPVHIASQRTNAGFVWSDLGSLLKIKAHHRRVLKAAAGEGLGDGFTVPAHLPGESNGTCSFAMKTGRSLPQGSLMAAQLVGTFAMEAGRRLVRKARTEVREKPKLSQRQLECLVFVAHGKSDWEISQILNIRESTVRDYVDEACHRYNVHRRVQLVVRALHDGQLTLRDAIG